MMAFDETLKHFNRTSNAWNCHENQQRLFYTTQLNFTFWYISQMAVSNRLMKWNENQHQLQSIIKSLCYHKPSIYDYLISKQDFSNGLNSSNMAIKSNYYHFLLF